MNNAPANGQRKSKQIHPAERMDTNQPEDLEYITQIIFSIFLNPMLFVFCEPLVCNYGKTGILRTQLNNSIQLQP